MMREDFSLPPEAEIRRIAEMALYEDGAWDDITTGPLVPLDQSGRAVITAKAEGVICGLPVAAITFSVIDENLAFLSIVSDGERVRSGQAVAYIDGSIAAILRAERVALNFLQHLSGVATATAQLVQTVGDLPTRLRDTRKTMPGLRALERYAVRCGGGTNHRFNLADGVLIKDNHLAALRRRGLGIADAVRLARQGAPSGTKVEVEVTTLAEAEEAVAAGADELLLDNMSLAEMRQVVELCRGQNPRIPTEASGGITLDNVRQIAETGVDFFSSGAVTHSVKALDLSLKLVT